MAQYVPDGRGVGRFGEEVPAEAGHAEDGVEPVPARTRGAGLDARVLRVEELRETVAQGRVDASPQGGIVLGRAGGVLDGEAEAAEADEKLFLIPGSE
ncbi:hypothetical protein BJY27_000026 [Streptomyces rapamycinicus]|uniref:Uncharacterized protein n=1 Tax=Streptomyces rapamycinicus TaxID=1226757 RepID=A0ABR6L9Q1_9ACTN|nr:hypothetical protein [Streptomyces rapamycinicus]